MHPLVYVAHERLTPAELSAARLDGHLIELGEAYVPADAIESIALRAASLRPVLPPALAAVHLTAAWVHGAVDVLPVRLDVQRAAVRRIHHVLDNRLAYRDPRVPPAHLQRIAGVLVTTPARTLADLARRSRGPHDSPAVGAAVRCLAKSPADVRSAIVVLALQDGVPGKRAALRMLRELEARAAQEVVTR